jgi:hypothetical protein
MATQMITNGKVPFNGVMLEMGKPVLVDGRKGTPFLAWIRNGVTPDGIQTQPSTEVRFKWDGTYMPSDYSDAYGRKVVITEVNELAAT